MNEVEVSLESKCAAEPPAPDNERDPLAFGEGEEGEEDPLADHAPLVKTEPGAEPEVAHLDCADKQTDTKLMKVDEVAIESAVNQNQNEVTETVLEPTIPTEPIEKIEPESKLQSRKASTEEVKSKPVGEIIVMNVDGPSAKEPKAVTNGTNENNKDDSHMKGSEKLECYEKLNGEHAKAEHPRKRSSDSIDTESPTKKLCVEVEKSFPHHDNMINDYIQTTTRNNVDEIQRHTDQLLSEIQTLRELAQRKEHEWNNILHLKKVKEEILLRLLRRKQVLSFEKTPEVNGTDRPSEALNLTGQPKNFTIDKSDEISGVAIKQPGSSTHAAVTSGGGGVAPPAVSHYSPLQAPPPYDKHAGGIGLPKPMFPQPIVMPGPRLPGFSVDLNGQIMSNYNMQMGRQGPVKDVKSIIADYRQRHPETVPRRGRRMKSILNPQAGNNPRAMAPKDSLNNLGMLLNNMDMSQKSMLERLSQVQAGGLPGGVSFKDVLIQFANMQQQQSAVGLLARPQLESLLASQRQAEIPARPPPDADIKEASHKPSEQTSGSQRPPLPPPYPEISLHPVVSSSNSGEQAPHNSSLLHGILTKQASSATQTFSPTLAKLLTSPEKKQAATPYVQAKSCGEITITPVQPKNKEPTTAEPVPEEVVQLEEEESGASETSGGEGEGEAEGSSGEGGARLVIDEAGGGDVPLCQGCRRRDAQFVCAGCANQWYCSRDCQVAAWDEHSEMCSG